MITNADNLVCPLSSKDEPPWVDGTKFLYNGHAVDYQEHPKECFSPITKSSHEKRTPIGSVIQMDETMIDKALNKARDALNNGVWPTTSPRDRVASVQKVLDALQIRRDEIIRIMLWDSCKTLKEANQEFNQAISFAEATLHDYESHTTVSVSFAPVGMVLCWGAEVNSFAETYRILIPALVTGNILIVKVPCVGGLVHILTMEAFNQNLPAATVQFIVGPIDVVAEPLMCTGAVDMLALSGARSLSDRLIQAHPDPQRLKLQLHLDCQILTVVLSDANLSCAAKEITKAVRGCRSHKSGLKLVLVHSGIVQPFLCELCSSIRTLKCGLPWMKGVDITPLPGNNQPEHLRELLIDALRKGAMVVNSEEGGGRLLPEFHGTIMQPAIVYPVNSTMQLWGVREAGPIVAVASFTHIDEIRAYFERSAADLQVCVFTARSDNPEFTALTIDLPRQVGSVTANQVCLELHIAGCGTLPAGQSGDSWSTSEALQAFTAKTLTRCPSVSQLSAIDTSTDSYMPCRPSPLSRTCSNGSSIQSKSTNQSKTCDEDCIMIPGPFPSPIGVASRYMI